MKEEKEFLSKELKKIKDKKEEAKINYLYKEFFNDDNISYDLKLKKLQTEVDKDYNIFHNKLFKLLKLTTIRKR